MDPIKGVIKYLQKHDTYSFLVLNLFLSFIFITLFNNVYGLQVYGDYLRVYTLTLFLLAFTSINSGQYLQKYIRGNKYNFKNFKLVFIEILKYELILYLILFLVIIFFKNWLFKIVSFNNYDSYSIVFILLYSLFYKLRLILHGLLTGIKRPANVYLSDSVDNIFRILFVIVQQFFNENFINYYINPYFLFCCSLAAAIIYQTISFFTKIKEHNKKFNFSKGDLVTSLAPEVNKFLRQNYFLSIFKGFNNNLDMLVMTSVANSSYIAIFHIAKRIASLTLLVSRPLPFIYSPVFTDFAVAKDYDNLIKTIFKVSKKIVFRTFILGLFVIITGIFYGIYIDIDNIGIFTIMLLVLLFISILGASIWWGRIFAINFENKYSIYGNLITFILGLIFLSLARISGEVSIVLLQIFTNWTIITLYWYFLLYRFKKQKVNSLI